MPKIFEYMAIAVGMVVTIIISYWLGQTSYSWMPIEASTDAQSIDNLFSFLVTLASVIFFGVIGTIFYSLIFYRAAPGDYTEGHSYRHNWKLEVVWFVVPTILVMWIGIYSLNVYVSMDVAGPKKLLASTTKSDYVEVVDLETNPKVATTIGVVAKQWAWDFRYPNKNVTHELHLPVNKRVRLMLQSEDVLHGFYVPEFRIKQDIIPSRNIAFQFIPTRVGQYKLHDSQLSGTYYAVNEADVYVDTEEDYQKWLTQVTTDLSDFNLAASEYARSPKRAFNSHYPTVIPAQSSQITASNYLDKND